MTTLAGQLFPRGALFDTGEVEPEPPGSMILGWNGHMDWTEQSSPSTRAAILNAMASWGGTSARVDYAWGQLEPTKGTYNWSELDTYTTELQSRGLTMLLMLYWPPFWSSSSSGKGGVPSNPADYGDILGRIGQRYGSKLVGVEMWNEPDLDNFWYGTNAQFFNLLAGAYPVAKALAPSTTFIAAAPTYLGLGNNWFDEAYTFGSYRPGLSYDAQAIHPYMSPSNLPPDSPANDWSIHGIPTLQALRASFGDTSPLWATEFGWSSHSNVGDEDPWELGVTITQQADYTPEAYGMLADYDCAAAYVYTDRNVATAGAHEGNFGLLYADNSEKPVVASLRAVYNP